MKQNEIFNEILDRAAKQLPIDECDVEVLLDATDDKRNMLYATARKCRQNNFGNRIFSYGFVYFSTYCRNNCNFCFYRTSNDNALRYRKSKEEILSTSVSLMESGVNLLDLTMGEDPVYVANSTGFDNLLSIASDIKEQTGLPLMISPGVLKEYDINKASNNGIDFYACYQETHSPKVFSALREGQNYSTRLNAKFDAKQSGMLIEEGILVGVGESLKDIAHSILTMKQMGAAQVRVMSFVEQQGAPLKCAMDNNLYIRELNTLAVMRILMPTRFIPASLDVAGKAGLKERLDAGANIITSIIVPESGFAGVSNATLDVDNGGRTLDGTSAIVKDCGLQMGSQEEFIHALEKLHEECAYSANSDNWRQASRC